LIDPASGEERSVGIAQRIGTADAMIRWRGQGQEQQQRLGGVDYDVALDAIMDLVRDVEAVGHRFVHGGEHFKESVRIDDRVLDLLGTCVDLAPLHNPASLRGIEAAMAAFPDVTHVAVFDTAFHHTIPLHACLYPVPWEWYRDFHVRRYGFHGTSHRHVSSEAARRLGLDPGDCSMITAHLGNGCSTCAVRDGRSIDTSMGMTPLEGLMMGTRSGNVDPGLHAHMSRTAGMDVHDLTDKLNRESGLLGVSGVDPDLRRVIEAAEGENKRAGLAIEMFCYRLAKDIGGMAVALGEVDALVFTGGIGENSARVRAKVVRDLKPLGFVLDEGRNQENGRSCNGVITSDGSTVAMVVATNEAILIAREAWRLAG